MAYNGGADFYSFYLLKDYLGPIKQQKVSGTKPDQAKNWKKRTRLDCWPVHKMCAQIDSWHLSRTLFGVWIYFLNFQRNKEWQKVSRPKKYSTITEVLGQDHYQLAPLSVQKDPWKGEEEGQFFIEKIRHNLDLYSLGSLSRNVIDVDGISVGETTEAVNERLVVNVLD